ncbi:non-hydrolyzing UDP-N-acetylglucosamine 2-epimerase [Filimonas effusa]|uniref:UDP-N-acetylglucosamine 2-epimerase (non-hydrolyzing) n=1 Tax=Filimonas effusa TaxID=2508721 RepID=A0A4Q1DBV8_9BACT|nr:UDP-N-acetylglucosamine 2-epimerase (non-hydrolyzing) [Filimonas effusa]RXK86810.1 UDP-N-acetylglucosamine 2-epimerase (non-hydrolyzing) [Filimonas effusa]
MTDKINILFVIGTRPEAIKMAPVIRACRQQQRFEVKVCLTGQHKEMLAQVVDFFDIPFDFSLSLMKPNQSLFDVTADGLKMLEGVLKDYTPDWILVQGDTTTAFIGALAAFYKKIKVGHIEAGLRSGQLYSPFPEEANRKMISAICHTHFAPTLKAQQNLENEGITEQVYLVGNTVIDALLWAVDRVKDDEKIKLDFQYLNLEQKIILITGHRRESFGKPFEDICDAIATLAGRYPDVQFVYPVHLNPNIREVVFARLKGYSNIFLVEPLDYPHLVWLLHRSYIVITDSGGIQEEAPSLGKPVLVLREVTERTEGIDAGSAILVGTSKEKIIGETELLLNDTAVYNRMAGIANPYGDGNSAQKITALLLNYK